MDWLSAAAQCERVMYVAPMLAESDTVHWNITIPFVDADPDTVHWNITVLSVVAESDTVHWNMTVLPVVADPERFIRT